MEFLKNNRPETICQGPGTALEWGRLEVLRKTMDKGFLRRLRAGLAGALLLAGWPLVPAAKAGRPADDRVAGPAWWDVRMVVTARGEYTVKGGRTPIAGEYACRASWEGRLESDGEDFLLIHLRSEVLEWRLRETAGAAGAQSVLETPPK